ncbi:VC0807 family protein [Gluconacetobacter sacchari]|uniref:VC0807 family protein n=1 Tax=Gluconacetobacter sacchari TaxID=92759 RepID=UPI0039B4BEF6
MSRQHHAPRLAFLALDLAVNGAAPVLVYDRMHAGWGDVDALLASSLLPAVWGVGTFLFRRRIDALSVIALAGIALSLLAFVGGGSARLLELREQMATCLIGLAFLFSAVIGKPLIYPLARATMARTSIQTLADQTLADFDARRDEPPVRHTVMVMTLAWGFGLLANVAVSVGLIFSLPIGTYLMVGPVLGYATMGGLVLWTILYRRYRIRHAADPMPGQQAGMR